MGADALIPGLAAPRLRPHPLASPRLLTPRFLRSPAFPTYRFLHIPNVSRSGVSHAPPTEILDELIKRRMRSGAGVEVTQHHALMGVVDALLLSR